MNSREFFYEFGRALYKIDAFYSELAKEQKVNSGLLWVLYALNDGNAHSQKEISQTWDIPLSTINTLVVSLARSGYVDFVRIPGKKREKYVHLTDCGKEYTKNALAEIYAFEEKVYNALGEKTRVKDDLIYLLEELKKAKENK